MNQRLLDLTYLPRRHKPCKDSTISNLKVGKGSRTQENNLFFSFPAVLGSKPRTPCVLRKHSTTELYLQSIGCVFYVKEVETVQAVPELTLYVTRLAMNLQSNCLVLQSSRYCRPAPLGLT